MNVAIIETLQDEASRSADDLIKAIQPAGFTYANLLSVAEVIEPSGPRLKEVLVAAFSMRLCKMGPRVKADWLRALSTVALRA